jgi:HAD superfamily hydrolase (TIGR01458 family)
MDRLPRIKAVLLDLDCTIYFDGAPIPGASDALDRLAALGVSTLFLTNTDSKSPQAIRRGLLPMGLDIPESQLFTPASAALTYLGQRPGARCFGLLSPDLAGLLAPHLVEDGPVDHVIVGDSREFATYDRLNTAFRHIKAGAEILALQKGRYFIRGGNYNLDTGAFVTLLEFASGKNARVLGKPSPDFFRLALDTLGCAPHEAVVAGDDISTDIAGAKAIGAFSVLVRTGKYSLGRRDADAPQPDLVLDSIADLPATLESGT